MDNVPPITLEADTEQFEKVHFALAHYAALAVLAPPLPTTESYLDLLEYLEKAVCTAQTSPSHRLTLSIYEVTQLLMIIQSHLMILEITASSGLSYSPLPGPEHQRVLNAFVSSSLSKLPERARLLIEQQKKDAALVVQHMTQQKGR